MEGNVTDMRGTTPVPVPQDTVGTSVRVSVRISINNPTSEIFY